MQRTTTRGWRIAQMAAVFALQACLAEIGDAPGDAAILDRAAPPRRDAGATKTPDVEGVDGSDVATPDGGSDPDDLPPTSDGGQPPPPTGDAGHSDAAPPPNCAPPARQLRLLTRREYRHTVRDLFQLADPTSCPPTTFTFDQAAKKPAKVHVAGTFNQWAKTVAAGGWPLSWNGTVWKLERDLAPGDYAYKFVLDESEWVLDTANPRQSDDGQGGKNSLLTVICGGAGDGGATPSLPSDLTATFPVESRPRKDNLSDLFPFDDASEKQVVSPTHIEEYWRAGKTIAERLATKIAALAPCPGSDTAACASLFVRQFGARAFRRPLRDAEVTRYQKVVTGSSTYGSGMLAAVRAFLSSPHFLYRPEGTGLGASGGRLSAYETASALSYLFWGSMPDQGLFDAAAAGQLETASGIEQQARRLLADRRSRDAVGEFAVLWLGAEEILVADKDTSLFPAINTDLRAAMVEETRRFVENVVFDSSHSYDELLRADYTFVNGPLAALYGMTGVTGSGLQKQRYVDPYRVGLLGHASLLGTYARSDQTSPIKRGLFVRRRLLCQDLPPPPADVPPVPAVDPRATTRERFRQHTSVAGCASCHRYIDGIGFGFERFDAIGRLRDNDNGHPIDSSGDMNDVEGLRTNTAGPYTDVRGLADVLAMSQAAKSCLTTQYYRFSRGAFENDQSACALQQIQTRFRESRYDIRELLVALTQTADFTNRR